MNVHYFNGKFIAKIYVGKGLLCNFKQILLKAALFYTC